MLIRKRRAWELPESAATPEAAYLSRRQLLQGLAAGAAAGSGLVAALPAHAAPPGADLYPFERNPTYTILIGLRRSLASTFPRGAMPRRRI